MKKLNKWHLYACVAVDGWRRYAKMWKTRPEREKKNTKSSISASAKQQSEIAEEKNGKREKN